MLRDLYIFSNRPTLPKPELEPWILWYGLAQSSLELVMCGHLAASWPCPLDQMKITGFTTSSCRSTIVHKTLLSVSNTSNLWCDSMEEARVRTGPVPGSGPRRSNTEPNRSRIFFWTVAGPFAAFFDKLCTRKSLNYCLNKVHYQPQSQFITQQKLHCRYKSK